VTCSACDADHPAVIEYDARRSCYIHFCPEAGFVTLKDADLTTYRFRPEWLPEWLVASLPIVAPANRPPLVPDYVWHLGDTRYGDTLITIIVARRVSSLATLNRLASVVRPVHRADRGLVLTTSVQVPFQVRLPEGYEFLFLPEIMRVNSGSLMIDRGRLGSWINGMPSTTAKGGAERTGRPSPAARIAEIFYLRRKRGLTLKSDSVEATAIRAEWKEHAPDQDQPGHSTVRRHIAALLKTNRAT
jgi:hypothetical protein